MLHERRIHVIVKISLLFVLFSILVQIDSLLRNGRLAELILNDVVSRGRLFIAVDFVIIIFANKAHRPRAIKLTGRASRQDHPIFVVRTRIFNNDQGVVHKLITPNKGIVIKFDAFQVYVLFSERTQKFSSILRKMEIVCAASSTEAATVCLFASDESLELELDPQAENIAIPIAAKPPTKIFFIFIWYPIVKVKVVANNNKIRQKSSRNIFFVYNIGLKQLSFKYATYV